METTDSSAELAGVPPEVIERSRRLLAEIDARPKDAPISEIGRILHELRRKHKEEGGTFITSDEEFEREVRRYRFGIED